MSDVGQRPAGAADPPAQARVAQRQQAQNELLAKDNELQALRLQEAERKRQNQWLWIGLFGCTSLVLLVLLLWQLARRQAQLQAQTLEKQQSNQAG